MIKCEELKHFLLNWPHVDILVMALAPKKISHGAVTWVTVQRFSLDEDFNVWSKAGEGEGGGEMINTHHPGAIRNET